MQIGNLSRVYLLLLQIQLQIQVSQLMAEGLAAAQQCSEIKADKPAITLDSDRN